MTSTQEIQKGNGNFQGMGNQPLWRSMFLFLIPLILSNALQSIGQLAGSIIG